MPFIPPPPHRRPEWTASRSPLHTKHRRQPHHQGRADRRRGREQAALASLRDRPGQPGPVLLSLETPGHPPVTGQAPGHDGRHRVPRHLRQGGLHRGVHRADPRAGRHRREGRHQTCRQSSRRPARYPPISTRGEARTSSSLGCTARWPETRRDVSSSTSERPSGGLPSWSSTLPNSSTSTRWASRCAGGGTCSRTPWTARTRRAFRAASGCNAAADYSHVCDSPERGPGLPPGPAERRRHRDQGGHCGRAEGEAFQRTPHRQRPPS